MLRKNRRQSVSAFPSRQTGATLIFSLVVLTAATLLGVTSMLSSNNSLKMANSARDHAVAFQAAEAALAQAEELVLSANYSEDDFICRNSTSSRCFNGTCTHGLCFSGDLTNAIYRDDCKIAKPAATAEAWPTKAFWENNGARLPKVQVAKINLSNIDELDNETIAVPYMVEFLCYVPRDQQISSDENNRNGGVPLYRVTVRAQGSAGRSAVMLQSVFRAAG
jgi:type IV pilus assembly protein PilX